MMLAGLQKTTLVDFPGIVAATVFTRGCSFRCGFCHNPELVIPEQFQGGLIPEEEFFNFLLSRVGKLQGVCITGGEPLLQPDIEQFISHIKALGFKVKLDTNGSFPDRLKKIIKEGDIDYIAMDIKSPIDKYQLVTNFQFPISPPAEAWHRRAGNFQINSKIQNSKQIQNSKSKTDCHSREGGNLLLVDHRLHGDDKMNKIEADIKESIDSIMSSGIDYEFRTTVCHPYHKVEDFKEIGKMIKGAKRYFIQNFVQSKHINSKIKFKPFGDSEIKKAVQRVEKYVKKVDIR